MIAGELAAPPARSKVPAWAARLSLGFGFASLAFVFLRFLIIAASAVRSPYQRDYGEGIVWQQMRLMFAGKGYGPIDGFPAIVFHYPPVYHATVEALVLGTRLGRARHRLDVVVVTGRGHLSTVCRAAPATQR